MTSQYHSKSTFVWRAILVVLTALSFSLAAGCDDSQSEGGDDTGMPEDATGDGAADTVEPDTTVSDTGQVDDTDESDTATPQDTSEDSTSDAEDTSDDAVDTDDPDTTSDAEDTTDTSMGCGHGKILGRVCSPNGSEWLSDVKVTVETTDCDGTDIVIQDFTDASGFYELDMVPSGLHTLTIETGSFTTEIRDVLVQPGQTTDLTGQLTKTCLERRSAEIAVLTGVFDHVEVLLDGLGITYDLYEGDSADINPNPTRTGYQLLQDRNKLLTYDIIIINSGEWYRFFENNALDEEPLVSMRANLEAFVQSGGSIFVTDWAYYWAEIIFPQAITFYGDPDMGIGEEGPAKVGKRNEMVFATVETQKFRNAIGEDTMSVNFNWAAWVVTTGASFQSEVHVLASQAPIVPPPGFQENAPLVVSYQPTETSGTIFFSAFHASAQPTRQMEDVINFIIFQL